MSHRFWCKLGFASVAGNLLPRPANAADPFRVGVFGGILPGVTTRAEVLGNWGTRDQDFKTEEGDIVLVYRHRWNKG